MFLGFYTVNFLCFRGNRVNIQAVRNDEATIKSVHEFWTNLQVSFFDAYYINVSVKLNGFFPKSERKKKPIHVPIVEKIHRLESAQCVFLDHPKALVFSI